MISGVSWGKILNLSCVYGLMLICNRGEGASFGLWQKKHVLSAEKQCPDSMDTE